MGSASMLASSRASWTSASNACMCMMQSAETYLVSRLPPFCRAFAAGKLPPASMSNSCSCWQQHMHLNPTACMLADSMIYDLSTDRQVAKAPAGTDKYLIQGTTNLWLCATAVQCIRVRSALAAFTVSLHSFERFVCIAGMSRQQGSWQQLKTARHGLSKRLSVLRGSRCD